MCWALLLNLPSQLQQRGCWVYRAALGVQADDGQRSISVSDRVLLADAR